MKVAPIQNNFGTGEVSPKFNGRVDMDRYKAALATCLNFVPTIQGALERRPGTRYVNEVKDSNDAVRLMPFKFSATDAYMLEFGPSYIRFYKNHELVLDSVGDPYEVATDFTADEIFDINYTQSADVLYLVHPNHLPQKLSRYGESQWYLETVEFTNSNWAPLESSLINAGLVASGATASAATLTASGNNLGTVASIANNGGQYEITMNGAVTNAWAQYTRLNISTGAGTVSFTGDWDVEYIGSNKFILLGSTYAAGYTYPADIALVKRAIFSSSDVGRMIRLITGGTGPQCKITAVTSSQVATISHENNIVNGAYEGYWGLWYTGNGPAAACFFEDRLFYTGTPSAPQRIDGSQTGDYDNFLPFDSGGTVSASDAVSFTLNSSDVNAGKWLFSDEKGLLSGTLANEWIIKSASSQEAISPTSISAKQTSAIGSSDCYPVQTNKAVLFVQKTGRKVREFHYFYDVDGFRATDLTVLSDHLTASGLKQMAYQRDPQQIVWAVRNDGGLVALTYDRDVDNLRAGWHRHDLGGSEVSVESVAVIPSPDGLIDDVWFVVRREINGSYVRYLEYLSDFFNDETEQRDAYFLDCGVSTSEVDITAMTNASPIVATAAGHGLAPGDEFFISGVEGMSDGGDGVNDQTFTVGAVVGDTFALVGTNGTTWTAYISGGTVRKYVTTVSGLAHLNGETVAVLADGAVQNSKTVSGGSITLDTAAHTVHVGLAYNSDGKTLRLDAGSGNGTSIGKTRRINSVGFMLHRSLNIKVGSNFDELDRWIFRNANENLGEAPALQSGIIEETLAGDYDSEGQICFRQDQPLPLTVLAVMPDMTTQDG